MNPELCKLLAVTCSKSYDIYDEVGFNQYALTTEQYEGNIVQVLSIPGTNEFYDMFSNLNLCSKKGIKYGAYEAAYDIRRKINIDSQMKLYVVGHSLGGATAIAYKKLFHADYCVAFAPARSLRYWAKRKMKNTTLFIDPDDAVPNWLGRISFGHPICEIIEGKRDHWLISFGDHKMRHWVDFTNNM